MPEDDEWPPKSPLKALLSSPSGRKRYHEFQNAGGGRSPAKLLGSPSLLEKLRAARADRDHEILEPSTKPADDDDEDEEILQLKLQAIEAKLKLKKLQQQKARNGEAAREGSSTLRDDDSTLAAPSSHVKVALSPNKRPSIPTVQRSPSRVLLGIDKGLSAEDVSLRRARTINGSPTKTRVRHVESRLVRPGDSASRSTTPLSGPTPAISFSERMAHLRESENEKLKKSSAALEARSSRFKYDKDELKTYRMATDSSVARGPSNQSRENTLDTTSAKVQTLHHSRSLPALRSTSPAKSDQSKDLTASTSAVESVGDSSLFEGFSKTHLSSRILPHTFLKRTLPEDQFRIYPLPRLLKEVTSPAYSVPDDVADYVVFGIVASKSSPLTHKQRSESNNASSADWEKKWDDGSANRQKFIVLKLTDLKWTVDLFLFDTAVPKYHRIAPGTLIAILNPGIMPPKKGKEDTGAFSLTLHDGEDQILEIGTSKYLGHCSAIKKDGNPCGDWVDKSKTEICEFHLNAQLNKTRSGRSGINSMTTFGGSRRDKNQTNRQGFDYESQSRYYAVGGVKPSKPAEERWSFAPTANASLSTAKLLDSNPGDDPFLAEGQMADRDKRDRLRRRMAAMEKEHEIAKRLGKLGSNAGGEYMRTRTTDKPSKTSEGLQNRLDAASTTKADILKNRPGESKKRAADSVRLSPVKKKTRFVTDKGIKEAGRESIGPNGGLNSASAFSRTMADDDDDDSDLDII